MLLAKCEKERALTEGRYNEASLIRLSELELLDLAFGSQNVVLPSVE